MTPIIIIILLSVVYLKSILLFFSNISFNTVVNFNIIVPSLSREKRDIAITFVCLFVCLLAGFRINYWSDFDEIW